MEFRSESEGLHIEDKSRDHTPPGLRYKPIGSIHSFMHWVCAHMFDDELVSGGELRWALGYSSRAENGRNAPVMLTEFESNHQLVNGRKHKRGRLQYT